MWQALRAVAATGTAHALLLEGGAGYGKTRLAAAVTARAHESGTAFVVRCASDAHDGADVVRALERWRSSISIAPRCTSKRAAGRQRCQERFTARGQGNLLGAATLIALAAAARALARGMESRLAAR